MIDWPSYQHKSGNTRSLRRVTRAFAHHRLRYPSLSLGVASRGNSDVTGTTSDGATSEEHWTVLTPRVCARVDDMRRDRDHARANTSESALGFYKLDPLSTQGHSMGPHLHKNVPYRIRFQGLSTTYTHLYTNERSPRHSPTLRRRRVAFLQHTPCSNYSNGTLSQAYATARQWHTLLLTCQRRRGGSDTGGPDSAAFSL